MVKIWINELFFSVKADMDVLHFMGRIRKTDADKIGFLSHVVPSLNT